VDWRVPGSRERYDLHVTNPHGSAVQVVAARLDGRPVEAGPDGLRLPLVKDGAVHRVEVELGPAAAASAPRREGG
jgi:hypothetical protein